MFFNSFKNFISPKKDILLILLLREIIFSCVEWKERKVKSFLRWCCPIFRAIKYNKINKIDGFPFAFPIVFPFNIL